MKVSNTFMTNKEPQPPTVSGTSSEPINRRQMLGLLGSGGLALVAGFDPIGRRWLAHAQAAQCPTFSDAPQLDGVLLLDPVSRAADSRDQGNFTEQTPCAVLRPESVADIAKMIQFCRQHGIKVAARGQGHTTFGQSLVSGGLVVEMAALNTIHSIGPEGFDADAGVLWKDLVQATFAEGFRVPTLTGYLGLTVGGTLSVGGISTSYLEGGQVDRVQELEVVTGTGQVVRCSESERPDLFEAALAGLGQCGIITRVKMDLVPAKPLVRLYLLTYTNNATFFRDLRTLANRGEVDGLFNLWFPFGTSLLYQLNVVVYFDPAQGSPNDAHLLRGLSVLPLAVVKVDLPYLVWQFEVDLTIDTYKIAGWDRAIKPWFDVFLPDDTIEGYVGEVIPSLSPLNDWSPTGFILILLHDRAKFTRPFFRLPAASRGRWVYLFDILNDSTLQGLDPTYKARNLARNRALFELARERGGTRYPIGAVEFDRTDWLLQYGEAWPEFARRKRRFDPDNILTPGPGIFA
jgi:cytokinin dehydrogenase